MNEERLLKIEEIYHKALEISARERIAFLVNACGDDKELLDEVKSLLSFAEIESSLIDTPPMDVAAEIFSKNEYSEFIGKEIGQYKIISHIGTGGMGEVFLAEDSKLERLAAIKFIKPEIAQMPDQFRRFLQEAKTASSLNHPNIITVYEIGGTNEVQYIATEYIEGKTLREVMGENSITLDKTLDIISQVVTAVQAAHKAGIIHRDIKPENIMVRDDGLVKVLDFGLAKLGNNEIESEDSDILTESEIHNSQENFDESRQSLTLPGLMMGTVAYMSPEQTQRKMVDLRSDIWSIGVVLFEMLTGQKPFAGETVKEKIDAIHEDEPAFVNSILPIELKRIIEKSLEKNVCERYQNARELLIDIEKISKELEFVDESINQFSFGTNKHITSANELRITKNAPFTNVNRNNSKNNVSSAEFVFSEVKRNKIFSSGILLTFIAALSIGLYFYSINNSQMQNSIAVMPFINESGEADMEYLSDGISESLIDSLSQLSDVKVIAKSSTFSYKGKNFQPADVANQLGVRFILSGRIANRGDRLQISAKLIDSDNKTQLWGEQFSSKLENLPEIENEISRKIAEQMKIRLSKSELEQFAQKRKVDPKAYELFLKGRFYQSKSSGEGLQKAIAYFKQAIEMHPNYAEAYAALATSYLNIGENSFEDPKTAMPKAKAAASIALKLNENISEVHLMLAGIKRSEWDWKDAEREYKRALEINPNLAKVYFSYAFFLSTQGKHDEAIFNIKRARELDPLKPHINIDIAYIYYFARKYDLANEQYEIGRELNPNYGGTYYGLGFIHAAKGDFDEAIINYKKTDKILGGHTGVKSYLGFALAKVGKINEAKVILKDLESGENYISPVELAILYVGLNEREKAIKELEKAYKAHDSQMQYLGIEPHFDSLRSDKRFTELMKRVDLPLE